MNGYNLQEKFDHYNNLLFNNEIPKVDLKFAPLKSVGGCCEYRFLRSLHSTNRYNGAKLIPNTISISISNIFIRDEQGIDGILIHEMIHAFLASTNEFKETHGVKFKRILKKCSEIVGFSVPLYDSIRDLQIVTNKPKKIGVTIVQTGIKQYRFAITSENVLKTNFKTIKDHFSSMHVDIKCLIIESDYWTQMSFKYPVQRNLSGKTRYYLLNDDTAIDDLLTNGIKIG